MAEAVGGKEEVFEVIEDGLGGLVEVRVYLVAHHLALAVELRLGKARAGDEVGNQLGGATEVRARKSSVDNGVFLAREGVELTAHRLHAIDDVPRRAACRALEDGVFDKVCQPCLTTGDILVTAAGADGGAEVAYGRSRLMEMDAPHTVVKCEVCGCILCHLA